MEKDQIKSTVVCILPISQSLKLMSHVIRKWAATWQNNKMAVRPAKTQISLGIRPVWSEFSLCAWWVVKDPSFPHADSEDSDQTGWMPRLIWVFAGRIAILLVLSCRGLVRIMTFTYSIYKYYTIHGSNNKDADQTARMRRLICVFVVRIRHKTGFLMTGPK